MQNGVCKSNMKIKYKESYQVETLSFSYQTKTLIQKCLKPANFHGDDEYNRKKLKY